MARKYPQDASLILLHPVTTLELFSVFALIFLSTSALQHSLQIILPPYPVPLINWTAAGTGTWTFQPSEHKDNLFLSFGGKRTTIETFQSLVVLCLVQMEHIIVPLLL